MATMPIRPLTLLEKQFVEFYRGKRPSEPNTMLLCGEFASENGLSLKEVLAIYDELSATFEDIEHDPIPEMPVKPGEIVEAQVSAIYSYGAVMNTLTEPPVRGMLHIKNITHEFVNDIEDYLAFGDVFRVKVIAGDQPGRVGFSTRLLGGLKKRAERVEPQPAPTPEAQTMPRRWTKEEEKILRLALEPHWILREDDAERLALQLGRTRIAIQAKAAELRPKSKKKNQPKKKPVVQEAPTPPAMTLSDKVAYVASLLGEASKMLADVADEVKAVEDWAAQAVSLQKRLRSEN